MENTKTDGIGSGLVVVAYIDTSIDLGERLKWRAEFDDDQPLVRLSDAEAIIAAKDAEIERLKDCREIDAMIADEHRHTIEQQAESISSLELLAKTQSEYGVFLKTELGEHIAKQSAALKLASLALSEGVEYVEEPPEKNCTCHLSPPCNDCVDHSAVREFFIDARKALAAIDALGA